MLPFSDSTLLAHPAIAPEQQSCPGSIAPTFPVRRSFDNTNALVLQVGKDVGVGEHHNPYLIQQQFGIFRFDFASVDGKSPDVVSSHACALLTV